VSAARLNCGICHVLEREIECKHFGGFDPGTLLLALAVDAPSLDDARSRMAVVAPLLGIAGVDRLMSLEMVHPSRDVLLSVDGHFECIKVVASRRFSWLSGTCGLRFR
jgi:hypothetical protein